MRGTLALNRLDEAIRPIAKRLIDPFQPDSLKELAALEPLDEAQVRREAEELILKVITDYLVSDSSPRTRRLVQSQGPLRNSGYCYARPTHEYLGFSAGLDFETRIMVKEDAAELLRGEPASKKCIVTPEGRHIGRLDPVYRIQGCRSFPPPLTVLLWGDDYPDIGGRLASP